MRSFQAAAVLMAASASAQNQLLLPAENNVDLADVDVPLLDLQAAYNLEKNHLVPVYSHAHPAAYQENTGGYHPQPAAREHHQPVHGPGTHSSPVSSSPYWHQFKEDQHDGRSWSGRSDCSGPSCYESRWERQRPVHSSHRYEDLDTHQRNQKAEKPHYWETAERRRPTSAEDRPR